MRARVLLFAQLLFLNAEREQRIDQFVLASLLLYLSEALTRDPAVGSVSDIAGIDVGSGDIHVAADSGRRARKTNAGLDVVNRGLRDGISVVTDVILHSITFFLSDIGQDRASILQVNGVGCRRAGKNQQQNGDSGTHL